MPPTQRAGSWTVGELLRAQADFPRSTSGKVQRQRVERWLDEAARP